MEFEAECRFPRLARVHRPRSVPGLIAALAALGFFVSLAPLAIYYADTTLAALGEAAKSGFAPRTSRETAQMMHMLGRILSAAFVVPLGVFILWRVLRDLAGILGRKLAAGLRGTPRGQTAGVHFGPMEVRIDPDALSLASPVSHVTLRWPAVASARLRGRDLVLALVDGTECRIAADGAPGGARAALDAARAAMAEPGEAPAGRPSEASG